MSAISPARRMTREEETRYKSAVSESVAQKMGGAANFINLRQFDVHAFKLNGPYYYVARPQLAADGIYIFPFDAEIINVGMFINTAGSIGTTEFDLKLSSNQGASWATIFSTTPKILNTAADNTFSLAYDITDDMDLPPDYQSWAAASQPTGFTAGVLSGGAPYPVSAGDALRGDLIDAAYGAENFELIVFHRPRN